MSITVGRSVTKLNLPTRPEFPIIRGNPALVLGWGGGSVGRVGSEVEVGRGWAAELVVALDGVEPVFEVGEWFGPDVVDVGAVVAGVGVAFHEAGVAKDAEVLADEWLAASEGVCETGRGAGLVCECPDDPLARVVGEQVERGQDGRSGPPVAAGRLHVALVMHRCRGLYPDRVQLCGHWVPGCGVAGRVCTKRGLFLTFLGCRAIGDPERSKSTVPS
jgi:hypothetical protein